MRLILNLFLWLCLLGFVALGALVWFALDDRPRVQNAAHLSHQDISRARDILQHNDPRYFPPGTLQTVSVREGDINLAVNYLLQRAGGSARVTTRDAKAEIIISLRLPGFEIKPYLNTGFTVEVHNTKPLITGLHFGRVGVPDVAARLMVRVFMALFSLREEGKILRDMIDAMVIEPGQVSVTYLWQPELISRVRDTLARPEYNASLQAYYNELVRLHRAGQANYGSLPEALRPVFSMVEKRSGANDPVIENQAVLLVLGAWAAGRGMSQLVPDTSGASRLHGFALTLEGRKDFAQHFLVSAALAAAGDSVLANAVGLFKEVDDSQGGSGFSFTDLAADLAGTRFGETATGSAVAARRLQKSMAEGVDEAAIIPLLRDLPEGMDATEFARRYDGVGSPAYLEVLREIESRLEGCSLYQ